MGNQFEKQVLVTLEQINFKLDRQDETLKSHSEMLNSQGEMLKSHSEMLKSHSTRLSAIEELQRLQGETLKEHTSLFNSLKIGQEYLQAEISEMRIQNAKEFGEMKEQLKGMEDSIDLLKEETWKNKKDIRRIQKTMGMS